MAIGVRASSGCRMWRPYVLVLAGCMTACSTGGGGMSFPDAGGYRYDLGSYFVYDLGVAPEPDVQTGYDWGITVDDGGVGTMPDPAPEVTAKGIYFFSDDGFSCTGCPVPGGIPEGDSGIPPEPVTDLHLLRGESSTTIDGAVFGAVGDGAYFVHGAGGMTQGGLITTDSLSGAFQVDVPLFCGQQLIKLVWRNGFGRYVQAIAVEVTDCLGVDILVTLTWDALGKDWELHLIKPGGKINDTVGLTDCTSSTCVASSPDWGVQGDPTDNPHKDVDDTGADGPENIFLTGPESGTYYVLVEAGVTGSEFSSGQVEIRVAGQDRVVVVQDNLPPMHVWKAATISWPSGTVTPLHDTIDCTKDWNAGCQLDLP